MSGKDLKDGDSGNDPVLSADEIEAMVMEAKAETEADGSSKDGKPKETEFPALSAQQMASTKSQYQRIPVPPHRQTPLQKQWMDIYTPIVEHMKLQIRYNPKRKVIEIRTSPQTESGSAMQKAADFVRAFLLGFAVKDAIALLRLEDLYIDTFETKDVKNVQGEHLSRAIGRIAGQGGKTKYTIENATRTRIVLADSKIHILGSFQNIAIAKRAISRLIMGAPPGSVYTNMRSVANRQKERF